MRYCREPEPFDLDDPGEIKRLHHELYAYMKISVKDGTDYKGRKYALDALAELVKREENE